MILLLFLLKLGVLYIKNVVFLFLLIFIKIWVFLNCLSWSSVFGMLVRKSLFIVGLKFIDKRVL